MRKLLLMVLIVALLVPMNMIQAQEDDTCEPDAVAEWLIGVRSWFNVLGKVMSGEYDVSDDAGRYIYHRVFFEVGALERPACADQALIYVYQDINNIYLSLTCQFHGDSDCAERVAQQAANSSTEELLSELQAIAGIEMDDYADELPANWDIDAVIALYPSEGSDSMASEPETADASEAMTDNDAGSRTNPYPIGEWVTFSAGDIRVVSVDTDYQASAKPAEGNRFIAARVEWHCQLDSKDETCKGWEIDNDYVFPSGNLLGSNAGVYDAESISTQGHEGYSGATIEGNIYFEIPTDDELGVMRLTLDNEDIFFSLE